MKYCFKESHSSSNTVSKKVIVAHDVPDSAGGSSATGGGEMV